VQSVKGETVVVYADPLADRLPLAPTFESGQGELSENDNILTGKPPRVLVGGGFTTQQMLYHRLSRRVNNMTGFPDITHSGFQDMTQ
jgi:hypothetical protein